MDTLDIIRKNDILKLRALVNSTPEVLASALDTATKQTPLHVAASTKGAAACLELLLKQSASDLSKKDSNGDTPLHLAVQSGDFDAIRLLLAAGADAYQTNASGKRPVDDFKAFLSERTQSTTYKSLPQTRLEALAQLEDELPRDAVLLRKFVLDLAGALMFFQDKCKDAIHQLVEEKYTAVHKYRLLENAAGIKDGEQSGNFLSQLQYLQTENEQQAATIGYLRLQGRMLEASAIKQEEHYRKNLAEMSDHHQAEMKGLQDTINFLESKLNEVQKKTSEEVANLQRELEAARGGNGAESSEGKSGEDMIGLNQRVKDLLSEKVILSEKLKSAEQMKSLHEREITKLRNDVHVIRKAMQDAMTKVLSDTRNETDEKDEKEGHILFVRGENGSKQIKGATPEKLVERLTDGASFDSQFQNAFMLTFRSFMDCTTLLNLLIKRYKDGSVESGASIASIQTPNSPVQLRVCNVVKTWVESYWTDFANDKALLDKLTEWVDVISRTNPKLATVIKTPLQRRTSGQVDQITPPRVSTQPRPKPVLPKALLKKAAAPANEFIASSTASNLNKISDKGNWSGFNFGKLRGGGDTELKLMDMEPLEVARQLTLIEYDYFTRVQPTEFMDQAWMKDDKETRAPNICNMTAWSNHVTPVPLVEVECE